MDLDAPSRHLSSLLTSILVNTVKIDGIDFHRMENFARNHLRTKYGFADSAELHSAIKASCDAGVK